ncbi:polar growth protein, partial [Rhizopus stolonifer]
GVNEKGEIGLFPVTYTVTTPQPPPEDGNSKTKIPGDQKAHKHNSSLSSKNMQSIVKQSLNNSAFQSKPAEEWDSEQVAIWITNIGFDESLADIFRNQEITGDILLELTVESLKELEVDTFGKRFKLHAAITALKGESNDNRSITSPLPELTKKQSDPYHNTKQPYPDDDMVSNYSTVIRNSQLPSRNETRSSLDSQRSTLSRNNSQGSYNDIFRPQSATPRSILPERRHTVSNNVQENKFNFARASSNNKLHTVIPSTAMVRRSEDTPIAHETPMTPDMEGWLYKQGDRYKNWNKRWFVLKGNNLFYFKSPKVTEDFLREHALLNFENKAVRMKGIINLKGYRVEVDSSIQAGKYCFKVHHEKERTFYFYADQEKYMKEWVKAMMKATIERDYGTPVMSSSTIPTVSLEAARRMRPRPPSTLFQQKGRSVHSALPSMEEHIPSFGQSLTSPPTSIMTRSPPTSIGTRSPSLVGQKMRITDNTSDYTLDYPRARDDSGFNSRLTTRSPTQSLTRSSSGSSTATKNSLYRKSSVVNISFYAHEEEEDLIDPENASVLETSRYHRFFSDDMPSSRHYQPTPQHQREVFSKKKEYIDWVNLHIQDEIDDLVDLSTGESLLDLLECLSNKEIKRLPTKLNQSVHSQTMDRMITAFEYMHQEGIELDNGYTFRDILSGQETKIMSMLDSIKAWYGISLSSGIALSPFPKFTINKKTASGGTFGEEEQNKLRALDDPENILV